MRHSTTLLFAALATAVTAFSCGESGYKFDEWETHKLTRVNPQLTYLKDAHGRYLYMHGVNASGSTKVPYEVDPLTYIGRPFPLDDADRHLALIKAMGFNSIRLLFMWEAVEPHARGVYDTAFLDYFEAIISKANEHGLYVLINAHENLFSRFHNANYNEEPLFGTKGDIMGTFGALFPYPFKDRDFITDPRHKDRRQRDWWTDQVKGDGAPKWAVKACLPEKDLDAKSWGTFRPLGSLLTLLLNDPDSITGLLAKFGFDAGGGGSDDLIADIMSSLLTASDEGLLPRGPHDSTDFMPWTFWGINAALSADIERCYAAFFAGDKVYPRYTVKDNAGAPITNPVTGTPYNIKEYLQEAYTNAWVEVVKRAAKYPNIIGYDIMNEPTSVFIVLTAATAYFQGASTEAVTELLVGLAGEELGNQIAELLFGLYLLPDLPKLPDSENGPDYQKIKKERNETAADWGFPLEDTDNVGLAIPDLFALLDLNLGFAKKYLQPLYERVGAEVLKVDPQATIWIEEAFSPEMLLSTGLGGGVGGQFMEVMTVPAGIKNVVFSPHWYPDIYPFPGFNVAPREFTRDELRYRDYGPSLKAKYDLAAYSFSNVPTVYGEFGTYWNYGGIEKSVSEGYILSAEILDNFYEAFEGMFLSNMLWCYTADNDYRYGDLWNKEDFSVLDPFEVPRGREAYSRPHATFLPGKPVSTHFYSGLHYFDPDKGKVDPEREFYIEFESKETDAPAEIFVPELHYPDGFYVWLSDGFAIAEYKTAAYGKEGREGGLGYHTLYYFPSSDEPGRNHSVMIAPPLPGRVNEGWSHFFRKGEAVSGK
ncbi:MAG: cellulase family glycosylhydrolase [Deltaproteobacteria bacterium]|nr:cellulase family glycosylhydrolase [Deltaproteobacteria bacterium]